MSDLKIKLTTMGKAALVDDANIGTEALKITSFEIGSNYYEPNGSETELQSLIKSMPSISGEIVSDHVIHISLRDETNDEYDLGEIGLRTQNGVLLGIISSEDSLITSKGANDILLIAADIIITEGDVSNITFGDTNFMLPTGTEDKQGIYELATDAEVDEKLPGKVVDGKKLHDAITRRSSSAINSEDTKKLATSKAIHTLAAVIAANKAITDASLNAINAVIQSDNADLDTLNEIAAIITAVKNTQDTLAIGNIAGLQAALNNKTNTGHGHVINDITNLAVTITSLTTAINSKANNHSHPYASNDHNHDSKYLPQNALDDYAPYTDTAGSIGGMLFGKIHSNSPAHPLPAVIGFNGIVDFTSKSNWSIDRFGISSNGTVKAQGVSINYGRWQCLGYAGPENSQNTYITLWRRMKE